MDHEAVVSEYFENYVANGKPGFGYILGRPGESIRAFTAFFQLPCLYVSCSAADAEGAEIRSALSPSNWLSRVMGYPTAGLNLPCEAGQYSLGAARQTLRRKVRQAKRLGVRWAEVTDPAERRRLLAAADEQERCHPDETYRNLSPDNNCLLGFELWLAAYSADGHPLLLSVTPVEGEYALLKYFRTLGVGDEFSNARYLMTEVLVENLIARGVRFLVEGGSLAIPNGLRHFQRMLGFHFMRTRIADSRSARLLAAGSHGRWRRGHRPPVAEAQAGVHVS